MPNLVEKLERVFFLNFLQRWLKLEEVAKLDTALTSTLQRQAFLELLSTSNCKHTKDAEFQFPSSLLVKWMVMRKILFDSLTVSSDTLTSSTIGIFGSETLSSLACSHFWQQEQKFGDPEVVSPINRVFSSIPNLSDVKLTNSKYVTGYNVTINCPHLTSCDFTFLTKLTDDFVVNLSKQCPLLSRVVLSQCKLLTDTSIVSLVKSCKALSFLHIGGCKKLTAATFQSIASECTQLTGFNMDYCTVVVPAKRNGPFGGFGGFEGMGQQAAPANAFTFGGPAKAGIKPKAAAGTGALSSFGAGAGSLGGFTGFNAATPTGADGFGFCKARASSPTDSLRPLSTNASDTETTSQTSGSGGFGFGAAPTEAFGNLKSCGGSSGSITSVGFVFSSSASNAISAAGDAHTQQDVSVSSGGFGFGAPSATSSSSSGGFGFGAPSATTASSVGGGGFSFGASTIPTLVASDNATGGLAAGGFGSGAPSATAASSVGGGGFSVGGSSAPAPALVATDKTTVGLAAGGFGFGTNSSTNSINISTTATVSKSKPTTSSACNGGVFVDPFAGCGFGSGPSRSSNSTTTGGGGFVFGSGGGNGVSLAPRAFDPTAPEDPNPHASFGMGGAGGTFLALTPGSTTTIETKGALISAGYGGFVTSAPTTDSSSGSANAEKSHEELIIDIVRNNPLLTELYVRNSNITDKLLLAIAECLPNFKVLDFCDCGRVSDNGLVVLAEGCKLLSELIWEPPGYNVSGVTQRTFLAIAAHCPEFRRFRLPGRLITKAVLAEVSMDIDEVDLSAWVLDCSHFRATDGVKSEGVCKDKVFRLLAPYCTKAHTFRCDNKQTADDNVLLLEQMPDIKHLDLVCLGMELRDKQLIAISKFLTRLESAVFSSRNFDAKYSNKALLSLTEKNPFITKLDIGHCEKLNDATLVTISEHCRGLKWLNIWQAGKVTDEGIVTLANNCRKLQYLDASGCIALTDVGILSVISRCKELQTFLFNTYRLPDFDALVKERYEMNFVVDKWARD